MMLFFFGLAVGFLGGAVFGYESMYRKFLK